MISDDASPVRRAERARFLCSVDFGDPYDGLGGEFLKSNSEGRVVCKFCARMFYYSFAFVLTRLQPVAAICRRSWIARFVGGVASL